ncbi:hypothetical protein [Nocardia amikacinitolerans]|uniref:hypothetical protein n=1 Tax=Nocardia amikacinitolerans TaxID=756689 RepID=UPI000B18A5C9|nr:hypothetical protein [Nocardia amikacinitolerans]
MAATLGDDDTSDDTNDDAAAEVNRVNERLTKELEAAGDRLARELDAARRMEQVRSIPPICKIRMLHDVRGVSPRTTTGGNP